MAAPPLELGAVQDTIDWVLANELAVTPVGAPGVVDGVAVTGGVEAGPTPMLLVAVTVKL